MSRSLRIPGLVDLIRVDASSDIRVLADDGRLDRRFERRGPLINRILLGRHPARAESRRRAVAIGRAARGRAAGAGTGNVDPPARSGRANAAVGRGDHPRPGRGAARHARRTRARAGDPACGRAPVRRGLPVEQQELGGRGHAQYGGADAQSPARVVPQPQRPAQARAGAARRARRRRPRRRARHRHCRPQSGARRSSACASSGASRIGACDPPPMPSSRSACSRRRACCARPPCPAPPSPARCARARWSCCNSMPRASAGPGPDVEFMVGSWAHCPAAAFVPALLRVVWERAVAEEADEARS